jgi:lipopolysaccharide export LptBFGC system permease protein LptF
MKKFIVISVIVLVIWLWFSSRKKAAAEEAKAPAEQDPIDIAQGKITDLQKTIEQKLPQVAEDIEPVIKQAQKLIDDFQKEIIMIEKHKEYNAPILVSTEVAPDELQPQGKFFSIVKEAKLHSNTMIPKPKVLPGQKEFKYE